MRFKTYVVCRAGGAEIGKVRAAGLKAAAREFIASLESPAEWVCRLPDGQRYANIVHRSNNTIMSDFVVF